MSVSLRSLLVSQSHQLMNSSVTRSALALRTRSVRRSVGWHCLLSYQLLISLLMWRRTVYWTVRYCTALYCYWQWSWLCEPLAVCCVVTFTLVCQCVTVIRQPCLCVSEAELPLVYLSILQSVGGREGGLINRCAVDHCCKCNTQSVSSIVPLVSSVCLSVCLSDLVLSAAL